MSKWVNCPRCALRRPPDCEIGLCACGYDPLDIPDFLKRPFPPAKPKPAK